MVVSCVPSMSRALIDMSARAVEGKKCFSIRVEDKLASSRL